MASLSHSRRFYKKIASRRGDAIEKYRSEQKISNTSCVGPRKWEWKDSKIKFWGNFAFEFYSIYKGSQSSRNKREQWEHYVSQITICILFTSTERQVMNILGDYAHSFCIHDKIPVLSNHLGMKTTGYGKLVRTSSLFQQALKIDFMNALCW